MTRSNTKPAKPSDSAASQGAPAGETIRQRARMDEILGAARRILIEEGHHRLTMRNVAEHVGIKLASLQYYFPNKNELISALIRWDNQTYQGLMSSLLGDADSSQPDQDVAGILERIFREYQDERSLNFSEQIWALSVRDTRTMDQCLEGYADVWVSAVEMIGRIDPESTDAERRTRAAFVIALVDGLETFMRDKKLRRLLPDTMHEHVAKLIKSITRGERS